MKTTTDLPFQGPADSGVSVWGSFVDFAFCLVFVLFCCVGQRAKQVWSTDLPEVARPEGARSADTSEQPIVVTVTNDRVVVIDGATVGPAGSPDTRKRLASVLAERSGRVVVSCAAGVPIQDYIALSPALWRKGKNPPLLVAAQKTVR